MEADASIAVARSGAEKSKLRRELRRLDTVFFLISASGFYFPSRRPLPIISRHASGGSTVQTVIPCPDCGVPAEITERFSLPSTDGPVDHIVVRCAADHCFRMAADRLPAHHHQQQPAARRPAA